MFFRDKHIASIYIESCLINSPRMPHLLSTSDYFFQLHMEFLGGFRTQDEISEIVGEVLGVLIVKRIICECIVSFCREKSKKYELRSILSSRDLLLSKIDELSKQCLALYAPAQKNFLNDVVLAQGMAKNLNFLLSARQPGIVLEYELSVGLHLVQFREEVMKSFPEEFLKQQMSKVIKQLTGQSLI